MALLYLFLQLFFALFEGGLIWLGLTIAAIVFAFYSLASGYGTALTIYRHYLDGRKEGLSARKSFSRQYSGRSSWLVGDLMEAVVILHLIVIPPWYAAVIVDEFFMVGLYVIPTLGFILGRIRRVALFSEMT